MLHCGNVSPKSGSLLLCKVDPYIKAFNDSSFERNTQKSSTIFVLINALWGAGVVQW